MEPSAVEFVKASANAGNLTTGGASLKAFVLAHPVSLALIAGIAVGVIGYRFLHHENTPEVDGEAA